MTNRVRQSNFELLRLVAMFMVLALHANFFALGEPTLRQWQGDEANVLMRVGVESLSAVAVNVFVMISGWFGIRANLRGAVKLLFAVAFLELLCVVVAGFALAEPVTFDSVIMALRPGGGLWFVRSYLILYVLSPFLESGLADWPDRRRRRITFVLLLMCCVWGWWEDIADFGGGYSVLHFAVVYLLGRELRLSRCIWNRWPTWAYILLYVVLSAVMAAIYVVPFVQGESDRWHSVFCYNEPLVVLSAVCFFLSFARIRLHSCLIDRLAASALAVYVIHQCFVLCPHYVTMCRDIYAATEGVIAVLALAGALTGVMAVCLIVDQLRIITWKLLCRLYHWTMHRLIR